VYEALGFTPPAFGHMSLILAPDKSKLSKRHGATSVGDFKKQVWVVWVWCGCVVFLGGGGVLRGGAWGGVKHRQAAGSVGMALAWRSRCEHTSRTLDTPTRTHARTHAPRMTHATRAPTRARAAHQGYLAPAMLNFLSLLGWNDGSEQEIYTVGELTQAFSLDRITKSPAVFDKVKLAWMNGQHLRALPEAQLTGLIAGALQQGGVVADACSPFATSLAALVKGSIDLLADAPGQVAPLLGYPLSETVASEAFQPVSGACCWLRGLWGGGVVMRRRWCVWVFV
jgi:hypothetical protein